MDPARTQEMVRARAARLCEWTVAPPALAAFVGLRELRAHLETICSSGASGPLEWAMLGNAYTREGRYLEAIDAYERALAIDPHFAAAHLAIAELASMLHDEEPDALHRKRALALQRVYLDPLPVGDRLPLVMLLRDVPYSVNMPLDVLVDRTRVALHKVYMEGEVEIPPHAAAICAFGYAYDALGAIDRATSIAGALAHPIINVPARLLATAREALPQTLASIDGVRACASTAYSARDLTHAALPALVRPRDTHAGRGLSLVRSPDEMRAHLARFPAQAYHVTPFVEYRSPDGYYRKYRAILIDGVAYPYHLAISPRWMVHYRGSPMREHAWMREEEARFLDDPERAVPRWGERLGAIARAIGLEYVGLDLTVLPDDTLLVFEADAAMLLHDEDEHDLLSYKRPYVARIREAFHALVERRVRR